MEEALHPMPPKVATAIAAVMSEVPKLGKGEKNTHGNYNFASIDDFLEAVRPLCAKHGLIIAQDEESFEMKEAGTDKNGKPAYWLVMRFRFTLAHSSGETWGQRPLRTIMVSASMGSQAFGAAQSYALKQFQRSLFQIATGEKDADADTHPPADLPRNGSNQKFGPMKTTELKEKMRAFARELEACSDTSELDGLLAGNKDVLNYCRDYLPDWWFGNGGDAEGAAARITKRQTELMQKVA
jgi:hypothetical protein